MNRKDYSKQYYQDNKDKWKVDSEEKRLRKIRNQKAYIERNKAEIKNRKNTWVGNNFEWVIWNQAKRRAKKQGIEFTLELSDVVIPDRCPYLQWPLTRVWGSGRIVTNASIDRINSEKGYTKENIMVMSRQANEMKRDTTTEELIKFAQGILKTHNRTVED